jgi:hypothetical protein
MHVLDFKQASSAQQSSSSPRKFRLQHAASYTSAAAAAPMMEMRLPPPRLYSDAQQRGHRAQTHEPNSCSKFNPCTSSHGSQTAAEGDDDEEASNSQLKELKIGVVLGEVVVKCR